MKTRNMSKKTGNFFNICESDLLFWEMIISYHSYITPINNSSPNVDYEVSVFHTEQGHKYQFNSSGKAGQTIELVAGETYSFYAGQFRH